MGGYWIPGGSDGEGGKRPDAWIPNNNSGGGKKKEESGCPLSIVRVSWTILKVVFNLVFRGKKPEYVV